MVNSFKNILEQFSTFYSQLSPTRKRSLFFALFLALLSLVSALLIITGEDNEVLLSQIPEDQLPLVISTLKQKNIPFKIKDDGRTVTVPKELLHSTQMTIMSELGNHQIGQTGLEVFDKESFGTSSYVQRVNYQRALQGELMRSINSLEAVRRSKVILALPTKKTFLEEQEEPSASIVVELHPGKKVSEDQVGGIRFLVSSAVQGLSPTNVTVVDYRGKVLTRKTDMASAVSGELMGLKKKMEGDLIHRVESILSRVVGQGKVIAKVDVTLDPRQMRVREEVVDPEKTAISSSIVEAEKLDGARVNAGGVPGARTNLPEGQPANQPGFSQKVKKELKTTNFSVPKKVTDINQVAGSVQRISVAVLVDGNIQTIKGKDGKESQEWKPWPPEKMAQYENLVRNAIGFSEKRGDTVKIETIRFQQESFDQAEQLLTSLEKKKLIHNLIKWSLLGVGFAIFFFFVLRPFMKWVTESFQGSVDEFLPRTIEELEELQSGEQTLPGMKEALPSLEQSLDPDKVESEILKDRILKLVGNDEEKASGAFSLWLLRRDA